MKILAVDDEPLYLRLLKVNLDPEGYEVITASNGEEALELVSAQTGIGHPGCDDAQAGWHYHLRAHPPVF